MITHLNGTLIEKTPTHVVIECGGVGYFVKISLNTFSRITTELNKPFKLRKSTQPTKASQKKRVEVKKKRGELKKSRQKEKIYQI